MAEVRPFRGLRYNPDIAGPLGKLLCPPYDVISPEARAALRGLSPYNAVHVELPEAVPGDSDGSHRYALAAQNLALWRQGEALALDPGPSYYLARHRYRHRGRWLERRGLTARVRLQPFEERVILPHEETSPGPKADRLRLLQACRTNLSPIMALYQDAQGDLGAALERLMGRHPTAEAQWEDDQELTLWVVGAPQLEDPIRATLEAAPLFIADGHHRYETALLYRDQRRLQATTSPGEDAFDFVMVTLISFQDPGLLVLPYHRTLGGLDPPTFTTLRRRLQQAFHLEPLSPRPQGPQALEEAAQAHRQPMSLALLGPDGEGPYLLTLREEEARRLETLPGGPFLRKAAGWVLQEALFRPVLGPSSPGLAYVHDPQEAWDQVTHGQQQLAFFLQPFPLDLFQALVSAGKRLPPKSTYFYPKLPTGVVFYPLEVP
ncbi:MAG: DUF1015 domain-containing protein [Chloroflexi bacterium]|nr:DUF1015 domain-containing protein [Chloroflexota bacterium]